MATDREPTPMPTDQNPTDPRSGPDPGSAPIADAAAPMTQRRVLGLALPIIGELLLQTTVGVVDTLLVAQLGAYAIAGVGTALEIVFLLISIMSAVAIGATVLVSQAIGAAEPERANRLARQAVIWGAFLSVPLAIGGSLFAGRIVAIFGTEPDVAAAAATYLRIVAGTSPVLLLTFVCGAIFRGAGDSKTPLRSSLIANIVNVIAAYSLIFGAFGLPELGVAGSAWGATIGRTVSAAILIGLLLSGRRVLAIGGRAGWRPNLNIARQLVRLGLPAALEQILINAGFATMIATVALLGTTSLAAQQITFTALSVAFLPGLGFAIAATALVGQSIGAHSSANALLAARYATRWAVVWMATGALTFLILADTIMTVFTDEPGVQDAGARALRALALSLPVWGISMVNGGSLRGSGDTRTPLVFNVSAVWAGVGLAWLLVTRFDAGIGSVWLTFFFTVPFAALGNWRSFQARMRGTDSLLPSPTPDPHN